MGDLVGPESTELGGGASSSNIQEEQEMKQNLVPTPPLVPWLPALRGALADIDGFQTERKPSWFGGWNTLFTNTTTENPSTLDIMYKITVNCDSDTPSGDEQGGICAVIVRYDQGHTVSANNESNPSQTKYVPHPCHAEKKVANVPVGLGVDIVLCFSWGINDGVFITTTPNLTKASILDTHVEFFIPQDVGGIYDLNVHLTNNNSVNAWDLSPFTISQADPSLNITDSTAHLKLSDTSAIITSTTFTQSPSLGDIGGAAFLLWLVLKLLSDVHYRCTKPYAGQLEVPAKARRPNV